MGGDVHPRVVASPIVERDKQGSSVSSSSLARLVISQDFELHWGVRDKRSVAAYRENLLGARQAVPAMLRLFEEFSIHVTWATVGFLFFDGRDDLLAHLPRALPEYKDSRYSPYPHISQVGASEAADPYHFAPSLVRQILLTPGQEIGTHTFSHFYCLEPGNDEIAFEADLDAAQQAAARFGVSLRSIVFPRNQVNERYLSICARRGLLAYRGTQPSRFHEPKSSSEASWVDRAGRLADNYLPLSGHNGYSLSRSSSVLPYNVRASFFLRPHSQRLTRLEPLRKRRLLNELSYAARNGQIYHLWWHPHNFGKNLQQNLEFLKVVLGHFADLRARYGMQSLNMAELAEEHARRTNRSS